MMALVDTECVSQIISFETLFLLDPFHIVIVWVAYSIWVAWKKLMEKCNVEILVNIVT